jgi:hypothetical protein
MYDGMYGTPAGHADPARGYHGGGGEGGIDAQLTPGARLVDSSQTRAIMSTTTCQRQAAASGAAAIRSRSRVSNRFPIASR